MADVALEYTDCSGCGSVGCAKPSLLVWDNLQHVSWSVLIGVHDPAPVGDLRMHQRGDKYPEGTLQGGL